MKYSIQGEPLPVAICTLESGESVITERGSMSWMTPNIKMETTSNGGLGKMLGRALTGEAMFQNRFTATGGTGMIAFASSFPGSIRAFNITPGNEMIVQKAAYLASDPSVVLSLYFQKKLGAGLFGGEGFIMQKLSGNGTALIEIDGHGIEYELAAGQSMVIDTGYLAAMSASCTMNVETVKGVKNVLFGGESLFNTIVTGPGRIILQTMPIYSVARSLMPYMPSSSNN